MSALFVLKKLRRPPAAYSAGFTLFEILIAVIVLSLGLLGVGGLQLIATRSNFEGMQRTDATMLASYIIERMRVSSTISKDNGSAKAILLAYSNNTDAANVTTSQLASACPGSNTGIATCDLLQLAKLMYSSESLVNAKACITVSQSSGSPTGDVRVTIAWRGMTRNNTPTFTAPSNTCGVTGVEEDNRYLQQVSVDTYITFVPIAD